MVVGLNSSKIRGKLGFKHRFRFAKKMIQQNIFGGDRRVGFEIEYPLSVFVLSRAQRIHSLDDLGIKSSVDDGGVNYATCHAFVGLSGCRAFH